MSAIDMSFGHRYSYVNIYTTTPAVFPYIPDRIDRNRDVDTLFLVSLLRPILAPPFGLTLAI